MMDGRAGCWVSEDMFVDGSVLFCSVGEEVEGGR